MKANCLLFRNVICFLLPFDLKKITLQLSISRPTVSAETTGKGAFGWRWHRQPESQSYYVVILSIGHELSLSEQKVQGCRGTESVIYFNTAATFQHWLQFSPKKTLTTERFFPFAGFFYSVLLHVGHLVFFSIHPPCRLPSVLYG